MATHFSTAELEASLDEIRRSPAEVGGLRLIVRRPAVNEREELTVGELNVELGLVGDTWKGSKWEKPDNQITLMNSRAVERIVGSRERWALAGDQLYVDFDLSAANLPTGTRLAIGTAVLEITAEPHTGCGKFRSRFGGDALAFVNSAEGRALNLRGIYARVVVPGRACVGDEIRKIGAKEA